MLKILLFPAIIAVLLGAATCDAPDTGEDECADSAACAPTAIVPEVEYTELRAAWKALVARGFNVEFTPRLHRRGYAAYVVDRSTSVDPEPWLGDLNPEPGTTLEEGSTVTITVIECPNRARACE